MLTPTYDSFDREWYERSHVECYFGYGLHRFIATYFQLGKPLVEEG